MNKQTKIFLFGWAVIAVLQAIFTELHPDEAYYWVYANHLDWGQFHQPPMIAVFIKIGSFVIPGELGVRALSILANILTLWVLYKLAKPKDSKFFWVAVSTLFLVHAGSLLAVPDSPLILFCTLFIYLWQKFRDNLTPARALMVGIVTACILYSKYHGALFLLLMLFANLSSFKKPITWLIPITGMVLFVPHILWQAEHDWVSLRFHLFDRESISWSITWSLELLLGLLVLLGPVGVYTLIHATKTKREHGDRSLLFIMYGTLAFLFLLSLRNRVEANWSAIAFIPIIILLGRFEIQKKIKTLLYTLSFVFIIIISLVRVEVATGLFKPDLGLNFKYNYYAEWASSISEEAEGRPVVFMDSYQLPSLYAFYSGNTPYHYSTAVYPGNQFDLYQYQQEIERDTVLVIQKFRTQCDTNVVLSDGKLCYSIIQDYRWYGPVWISPVQKPASWYTSSMHEVTIDVSLKADFKVPTHQEIGFIPQQYLVGWMKDGVLVHISETSRVFLPEHINSQQTLVLDTPSEPGDYLLVFGIRSFSHNPGRNSYFYPVSLEQ